MSTPIEPATAPTPRIDRVGDVLAAHARERGSEPAVISGSGTLTWRELEAEVNAFAAGLRAFEIGPGGVVGLICTNRPEWVVAALGSVVAGARVAAINTWSRRWDLDHLLRAAGCDALVSVSGFGPTDLGPLLRDVLPEAWAAESPGWRSAAYPPLRELVMIGGPAPGGGRTLRDVQGAGAGRGLEVGDPAAGRDQIALVFYTSGSTARPKAVPVLQGTALEHAFDVGVRMGVQPGDRVWLAVPLFWSYGGANALMVALTHGCTLVLQEFFEAGQALALIEEHSCTVAYTLPNITAALLAHPGFSRDRVRSLRRGMTIGSPADVSAAAEGLGIAGICNAYGSTEIYGCCCATPHDWPLERKMACQGPPLPRIRVVIRDPVSGRELAPGEVGEICASGQVTRGYLGQPEANAKAFGESGEYRTGDLGLLEPDGSIRYAARATDMIKTGGINVAPAEVEEFLRTHPAVAEVAVTGVNDSRKGEIVAALVTLREGAEARPQELREFCRGRIASFKVPELVVIHSGPLPATDTGKLARSTVREIATAAWTKRGR